MNFLFSVLRWVFSRLDYIVIFVITQLYSLLVQIADANVFGNLIYKYLGRIYTFLGVFMVFKLSISIINYVINPDMLSDKSKGFSKLITNVVISLVLLAITPNIFDAAFNLQTDILKSNAVYQIVTGKKISNSMSSDDSFNAKAQANEIAYGVYSAFIYEDKGTNVDLGGVDKLTVKCDSDNSTGCKSNGECESSNPYCLVDANTVTLDGSGTNGFANSYWFLISTVCGCFVAYILLTFCIDASLRAVKLGFLQIVAPIPILSMIDPKTGTDKLMKWAKESIMTFIDLFIKLAGLFFAVDVIHSVLTDNIMEKYSTGDTITNPFVRLFIILGCLMFAKKLPSLIESILGIKLGGDGFSLKKKVGGALGGTALVAGGAMIGRAAAAGGKLGANTLNNASRLGLSTLKNKLTGKDNSEAVDRFRQRMGYAGQEAKGRFTSLNKKYSGDTAGALYKKNATAEREAAKQYDKGNKLWDEVQKSGDEYSIYSSQSFRDSAKLMNDAKARRNSASEAYDVAQTKFQRGEISQEEFTKARLASIDAQSDFDKAKAAFDEQSKIHTSDAEKYKLYSSTSDRKKAESHVNAASTTSSSSADKSSATTGTPKPAPKDMHANDDSYYNDMGM